MDSTPCFPGFHHRALRTAFSWFLLNSWYHSAGMVEKRTWLLWWWQAVTRDFRHCFPYPRFAPSVLLSGCFTIGLPKALVRVPPNSTTSYPGFLSNQNQMRCKFTGKLWSPLGLGSKTFSQRTARWTGEWTVAVAAAAPLRDGLCAYERWVPARTVAVPLCVFALISVAAALLLNSVWGLCVVCV